MALVCSVPASSVSPFAFIDCSSVSVSYAITGMATVSFTVVSTSRTITLSSYTSPVFGSNTSSRTAGSFSAGQVEYSGFITNYELSPIPGTLVYEHKIQLLAIGCRT